MIIVSRGGGWGQGGMGAKPAVRHHCTHAVYTQHVAMSHGPWPMTAIFCSPYVIHIPLNLMSTLPATNTFQQPAGRYIHLNAESVSLLQ